MICTLSFRTLKPNVQSFLRKLICAWRPLFHLQKLLVMLFQYVATKLYGTTNSCELVSHSFLLNKFFSYTVCSQLTPGSLSSKCSCMHIFPWDIMTNLCSSHDSLHNQVVAHGGVLVNVCLLLIKLNSSGTMVLQNTLPNLLKPSNTFVQCWLAVPPIG